MTSDFMAAGFSPDIKEQRRMQSDTLSAVFETYFRILKHTMESITARFVLILLDGCYVL